MKDQTYNGWTNYETWLVALWLDNERSSYEDIRQLVDENQKLEIYQLGDLIKGYVENMPEYLEATEKPSMINDLLTSALIEVDFTEIAQHLIDEKTTEATV